MMMKLGPAISMFSKTRAPDCAISVLIAERTAGLTPLWMSLATVNPFPSAITDPRMPFVFRRNSPRILPSCPSMPSSEKLERAAFRRDSLRCIPVPPGSVQDRSLFEQHGSARVRLLDHPEERTLRRPHDQEQLVRPVAHSAQPEDQQPGSDRRGTPTAIMDAQIRTVRAMNATVNAPRNRWMRFSMMNMRARRTSLSMRVNARNVTVSRPVMIPKKARNPTTAQSSAMAGRTLGLPLPPAGEYTYRSECSLLSLAEGGSGTGIARTPE